MIARSLLSLFLKPQIPSAITCRCYYIQKGDRGKISYGISQTPRWSNVDGLVAYQRILPAVLKISRQRFPVRHVKQQSLTAAQEKPQEPTTESLSESEVSEPAEVPQFARYAEFKKSDLEFTPSKLHVVWRIKSLSGRPKWEKQVMIDLKLNTPENVMSILKNTPEVNWKLWQVKHLVRITPLTFPEGIPDETEFKGLLLKRTGELVHYKIGRDNYNRPPGRPELEKYVLLREEKEDGMRRRYFHGTLDGTLLNTLETPWSGVNGERW